MLTRLPASARRDRRTALRNEDQQRSARISEDGGSSVNPGSSPLRTRSIVIIAAVALSGACAGARRGSAAGDLRADVGVSEWRLLEVDGRPALPADPARRPVLRFVPDSTLVFGNGGCNRFNASYVRNEASLQVGPILSTKMACADAAMNSQEQAFLSALQSTDRVEVSTDTLTLFRSKARLARLVR